MRNIIKLSTLILAFVLVGCNAVDDTRFKPNTTSGWVEFETSSMLLLSTDRTLDIPIEYNVPVNEIDTQISYTVEVIGPNPGVETGDFVTTVPADSREVGFTYDILGAEDNYTVRFTITATSNPDVIIGLDGDNPDVLEIAVVANWNGVAFFNGAENNNFVTSILPTGNPNEFSVSSCWGDNYVAGVTGNPDFEGQFVYPGTLTFNDDNTLVITSDDPALPGTVLQDDADDGNLLDLEENEIRYTLEQGIFTGDFTVPVILTPLAVE